MPVTHLFRSLLVGCAMLGGLALSTPAFAGTVASPGFASANPQTAAQRAMLDVVRRWHDTYNSDVDKMTAETYATNADVYFTGASAHGHAQFLKLEQAIKAAAPGRQMRIDRIHFVGDERVVVEAVILDTARPDFYSPWCAILEIADGRIVQDRTYLDPARWPGIEATGGLVTPGGLGAP